MTPEELLAEARAHNRVVQVHELQRHYCVTSIKHPPPCYDPYCSCFTARDIRTSDEEAFSYQDLSAYDVPKVQVGAEFLWVEALEIDVYGGTVRSTRLLFEGEVPTAPPEQPVVSTTSSEEMISRINRYVAAYLRQR